MTMLIRYFKARKYGGRVIPKDLIFTRNPYVGWSPALLYG